MPNLKNTKDTDYGNGHNGGPSPEETSKALRKWNKEQDDIDADRVKLAARNKKSNQELKASTGWLVADVKAAKRLADMEDEGEKQQKCESFKQAFNVLNVGMQFDWIDAQEKADVVELKPKGK